MSDAMTVAAAPPQGSFLATGRGKALPQALTAGFQRGLLISALCLLAAGAIALRASNTRGALRETARTGPAQRAAAVPESEA